MSEQSGRLLVGRIIELSIALVMTIGGIGVVLSETIKESGVEVAEGVAQAKPPAAIITPPAQTGRDNPYPAASAVPTRLPSAVTPFPGQNSGNAQAPQQVQPKPRETNNQALVRIFGEEAVKAAYLQFPLQSQHAQFMEALRAGLEAKNERAVRVEIAKIIAQGKADTATANNASRLIRPPGAPVVAGPFEDADAALRRGDYATALRLMRPLADQGFPPAQSSLGFMYSLGYGVPQNDAEAIKWYRLAAGQGDVTGQYNLGAMYNNGRGVPQDYVRAHMWFNLSAAQGDHDAAIWRDSIAMLMTPAQIAEAQKLAHELKPTKQPPQ